MTNAIENNVRDYVVPADSTKLFNNIVTFAKNLTLKDSKLYYAAETPLSEWWGRMLVKYEESGLTYEEALQVVYFINSYNKQVAEAVANPDNLVNIFGLKKLTGSDDEAEDFTYEGIGYKVLPGSLFDQLAKQAGKKSYYCSEVYKKVDPSTVPADTTIYRLDRRASIDLPLGNDGNYADYAFASDTSIYCVPIEGSAKLGRVYPGEIFTTKKAFSVLAETEDTSEIGVYYIKDTIPEAAMGQSYTPTLSFTKDILHPIDINLDTYDKYTRYYTTAGATTIKADTNTTLNSNMSTVAIDYAVDNSASTHYYLLERDNYASILEDLRSISMKYSDGLGTEDIGGFAIGLFTEEFIDGADKTCKDIAQATIILKSMDYIPVRYGSSSSTDYKYAATTKEKAHLLEGEQLPFVSLKIQNTNIPAEDGSITTESYLSRLGLPSGVAIDSTVKALDVAFVYKELNPAYRELLDSRLLEVFVASLDNGQFVGIPSAIMSKIGVDFTIPATAYSQERDAKDIPYLIQDYYEYEDKAQDLTVYFIIDQNDGNRIFLFEDAAHSKRLDRNSSFYLTVREDTGGRFYGIRKDGQDMTISLPNPDDYIGFNPDPNTSGYNISEYSITNTIKLTTSTNEQRTYSVTGIGVDDGNIQGTISLRYSYKEKVITKTTKLLKYRYGNPYMARRAAESDIITYYIGDDYISNSYGRYRYQRREIEDFLKVYAEMRDYYYRVLLNEAFINDKEYPLYEKTFLLFNSIERFMSRKIENLKDIDSYDETDIANFLASYGLEKLSSLVLSSNFLDEEDYSKALLKNYINLVQNKGSRKVIDILSDALSVGNKSMNIYKILFYHDTDADDYKFIKADYSLDNVYNYIRQNKDSSLSMENFLKDTDNPELWLPENTSPADLKKVGFELGNTKFIIPELQTEISSEYWLTRVNIEIILHILAHYSEQEMGASSTDYTSIILETDLFKSNADIALGQGVKGLLYLLSYYYRILYEDSDILAYNQPKNNFILTPITERFRPLAQGEGAMDFSAQARAEDITAKLNEIFFADNEPRLIYDIPSGQSQSAMTVDTALSYIFGDEALFNEMFSPTVTAGRLIIEAINALILLGKLRDGKLDFDAIHNYLDSQSKTLISGIFSPLETLVYNYVSGVYVRNPISADAYYIVEMLVSTYLLGQSMSNVLSALRIDPEYEQLSKLIEDIDETFNIDVLLGNAYASISEVTKDETAPLREGIVTLADQIETAMASTLQFNFEGKDDNLLEFLRLTIEYFISYTTEIYRFRSVLTYNTLAESPASIYDSISIQHTNTTVYPMDSFYYDEALDVFEDGPEA